MYADMGHFGRMPIRLAWFGIALPGLVLNYFGQAARADHRSRRDRSSVLPARAGLGALSAGRLRHDRHRDRLAGDHLRRLFADPASDPARLPAAHAYPAHHQPCDGTDLCAAGELAARRRDARRRDRLRHVGCAGRRLWHRGVAADGDHHAACGAGRAAVGLSAGHRDPGQRLLLRHRLHLLRRELDQAAWKAAGFRWCSPPSSPS